MGEDNVMLSSVMDSVEGAMFCLDKNCVILKANKRALELVALPSAELIGHSFLDLVHPEPTTTTKKISGQLFRHTDWPSAKDNWVSLKLRCSGGTARDVVVASVTFLNNGEPCAITLVRPDDISDKVATLSRSTLEKGYFAKNRFLASMSHELRTPLNAIIGFSDIIVQEILGPVTPNKYVDYAQDVNVAALHMLDLVNAVLEYSRLEENGRNLEISPVDLGSAVKFSVGLVRQVADEAEVSLHLEELQSKLLINGDESAVRQIILNLLVNAIQYNQPGGTVHVSFGNECGRGQVGIRDTGTGIKSEDIDRLFEPFMTLEEDPYSSSKNSMGLGLTIVRRLSDAMEADITIQSVPKEGTSIQVGFPLA